MTYSRFSWLWPYVRRQRRGIAGVMALATATSALAAGQPYLSKLVIDEGLIGRHFGALVGFCAGIVALAACGFGLGAFSRVFYVRLSGKILFAIREDMYAHILELPPRFFRIRPVGDLVTRLDGDVAEIQRFSVDSLLAFVNSALLLLFSVAVMVAMSRELTLVAAGALPFHLLLRYLARKHVSDATREVREWRGATAQFLVETLGAAKAVQSAGAEHWERDRFSALNRGLLHRLVRQQLVGYAIGAFSSLLSHATTAVVFIFGGWGVTHGALSVGTLVAFTAYLARGTSSTASLMGLYTAYQRVGVSLDRVQVLREAHPMEPKRVQRSLTAQTGWIRFHEVSFRYSDGEHLLFKDLMLDIAPGAKVVLFGDSGVGKSTLVDLLRGFAASDSGRILLDSTDLWDYDLRSIRRRIPVLETNPVLFRGSIMENLRYGNFEASPQRVLEAARQTGVDAFVSELPGGYESELGCHGAGISTGQRQRIAVTRALLGSPFALVLDEATSNLDTDSMRAMHDLIDRHLGECTRIIITHSPLTVPRADRILELRQGVVHEKEGAYAYA